MTQITDALRSISPSGSVNYARLVPASGLGASEPVVVIGIQKRTGVPDSLLDVLYEVLQLVFLNVAWMQLHIHGRMPVVKCLPINTDMNEVLGTAVDAD
ncbi:MAG: hypothetical protein EBS53_02685 [Bacteroidetes bacterium]|nr:hypothetical protein [Bacteroidota bacterium]